MAIDIHNYTRILLQERAALAKSPTSERNKIAILDLVQELALRGISLPRRIKYLGWLRRLAVLLGKDFHDATADDLKKLVLSFEQRREYSAWTRKDLRVLLKRLYGHLRNVPQGSSAPDVAWMSTRIACQDLHVPAEGQLLTQDEVHRLIGHATNLRDKAYISLLWESGCRVGELGNMQLKHVTFDTNGAILSVRGKTGSRQVRIIFSVPHLANWTACHPHANNPEDKEPDQSRENR